MSDMRLTQPELDLIAQSPGWRTHRVESFDTPVGRVIAKGHRPLRAPGRHRLLNLVAGLVGVPLLRAVPVHGGARSQAVEVARLQALAGAGAPVPRLLHVAPDHIVMSWLGGNQLANLLSDGHPAGFALWRQGADALVALHAKNQYLSQCFGRNMIVDDRVKPPRFTGMIDFEDDPLEVMGQTEAQVRDWLIYLQSTVWNLPASAEQIDAEIDRLMQAERPEVRDAFGRIARKLSWLRRLPKSRRFGRDTMALQAVAELAHRYARRHRAD